MVEQRRTICFTLLALVVWQVTCVLGATKTPPGIKTFSAFPRTETEVAAAHRAAKGQIVDFLPAGEALTVTTFTPYLTQHDRTEKAGKLPDVATRQPVLSMGIRVPEEDQVDMPQVSRGLILDYLQDHYVSLQARIQKDAVSRELYLHQRPLVATVKFGKVKLTDDFAPAVVDAVRGIHSLGLYLPEQVPPTPANLRTAVLVYRHNELSPRGETRQRYEFLILRARPNKKDGLTVHVFATSEGRAKLHYLKLGTSPQKVRDCVLQADVRFVKYSGGDLVPAESVVRRYQLAAVTSYSIDKLNKIIQDERKLRGDIWDHLNPVLERIVDGDPSLKDASDGVG
jgi:hypothetical protein